jgi:fucose permease
MEITHSNPFSRPPHKSNLLDHSTAFPIRITDIHTEMFVRQPNKKTPRRWQPSPQKYPKRVMERKGLLRDNVTGAEQYREVGRFMERTSSLSPGPARLGVGLILLAFVAYVSLGLPDGLLGVAWPSMKRDFALPLDALGALLVSVTIGYLASSFFGGRLMAHMRLGALLAASTFAAGAALMGYAVAPGWWTVVAIGVVAGLGGGGIDVALNTYVASNHGEGMMQWLHASYGVGATLGPLVMTMAINSLNSWRWGYVIVGGLQLALSISFVLTVSLWEQNKGVSHAAPQQRADRPSDYNTSMTETLRQPGVWLSMFLFFVYMGIEFTLGSWAYTLLTESRGVSPRLAGLWMGGYWAIFTVGRILAGLYTRRISQRTLVIGSLLAALAAAALLAADVAGPLNLFAVTIIGLAIAPVMPALISGTAGRVGNRYAANTIGIQIAAMGAGAAVIPSITGVIAQRLSLEAIPPFLIVLTIVLIASYSFALRSEKGR